MTPRPAMAQNARDAASPLGAGHGDADQSRRENWRSLLAIVAVIEVFLLGLVAVAPLGGVSQSISPLARVWPVLLVPARLLFGAALVNGSVPPEQDWPALALFAVLLVGASTVAALVVPVCRAQPLATRRHLALALGGAAVLGATLVLLPSLPSDDIFSYILYGRISVLHHANPLIVAPSSFPSDPFLSLVFWRGVRSVYGPVWLLLSGGVTLLAQVLGGSLATYVLLFKLLGFGAHLVNTALIWAILGRLAPRRRLVGTLLYAWNPLCLLEFCASAHNDAVMLTFALLAVYCLVREWEALALVAFGLSISTKYVWLALVPFYLVLVVRHYGAKGEPGRRIAAAVVWRLAVILGVVAVTAFPFWAGSQTLGAILYAPPAQQLDNSLLEALSWPLRSLAQAFGLSRAAASTLVQTGLKIAGLVVFAAVWLMQLRRPRSLEGMLSAWGWVLLAYVVVASGWFWPWYATWVVATIVLLPWSRLTVTMLLLSSGVLVLYAFLPLYAAPLYGLRAWLAFGPAVGYLAWTWQRARRSGMTPRRCLDDV